MPRLVAFAAPLSGIVLAASSISAFAGPAQDLARSRIEAIASGDVAALVGAYAPDASLTWIGGPLDGHYGAPDALKTVWTRFTTAQGAQKATIAAISEAANPKGATVTADAVFAGTNTVKVRYVLVYRAGKLVEEIWQVNPGVPG